MVTRFAASGILTIGEIPSEKVWKVLVSAPLAWCRPVGRSAHRKYPRCSVVAGRFHQSLAAQENQSAAKSDLRVGFHRRASRGLGKNWRRRRDFNANQSGANNHFRSPRRSGQKCHRIHTVGVCDFSNLCGGQLPFTTQEPIGERRIDPEKFREVRSPFVAFREHET